jgi:3-deoxy-D-manno-octulosonic-acid transferase
MVFPALAIAIALFFWEPVWLFHRTELRAGNEIVARVDAFRAAHGSLPETLEELGMNDSDLRVYYRKVSGDEYVVWFGAYSVGESVIFNSLTRRRE